MQSPLHVDILLPVSYILIGTFALMIVFLWLLRRLNVVKTPYGAMEWSRLVFVASVLFGIAFCASSMVEPVFHTYKILKSQQVNFSGLVSQSFGKFSQFFLLIFISDLVYMLVVLVVIQTFPGQKSVKNEIITGNIPVAALISSVIIGLAIIFKLADDQILSMLTPYVIDFH